MTEERKKRIPIDGNHADEAKNSDSGREPGQARESMPDDRELETVHTGPHVETGPGPGSAQPAGAPRPDAEMEEELDCLLYTSDAADDLLCVDLGGRRII